MFALLRKKLILMASLISMTVFLLSNCGYGVSSGSLPRKIESSSLPVKVLWQSELDEAVNQQPILTNEVIVVSTGQAIYSLELETGQRLWRYETGYQPSPVPIIVAGNKVVYGDKDGQITALDIVTGKVLWQRKLGDRKDSFFDINSMVLDNDVIYVASQPTAIEAIDMNTGMSIWSIRGTEVGIPSRAAHLFIEKDKLYVFTTKVHILNSVTGEIERVIQKNLTPVQLVDRRFYGPDWVVEAATFRLISLKSPSATFLGGDCGRFVPPYTFWENQFYAVGQCGGVYALDDKNNRIQWGYRPEVSGQSPVAIYHKTLYVLFNDGEIHAVDLENGETQGVLKTNRGLPEYFATAIGITANELVLIVTFYDNNVWAFH